MGHYTIERSKAFDLKMIEEIFSLDQLVYSEHMAGSIEEDVKRYRKAEDAFIILREDERIIAYLCFFPVTDQFYQRIIQDSVMYDNNIGPDDIASYEKGQMHHIFIISMVIHPEYKGLGLFKKVISAFKQALKTHHLNKQYIADISGYAVSGAGEHILKSFGAKLIKEVDDEGKIGKLYIADYDQSKEVNDDEE